MSKIKIALLCNLGMSSSSLSKAFRKYLENKNIECEINALSTACRRELFDYDVILIAPQVVFEKPKLEAIFPNKKIVLVDFLTYGRLDCESLYKQIF